MYRASLKPWLLAQYFKEFPNESNSVYILLDPDVIFAKDVNWEKFAGDDIWYESDSRSYMNSTYIKSKGEGLFTEMCEVFGISPELVLKNDKNAGGAQYVTKNNTHEFWEEVWRKSIPLYDHMVKTADKYKPEGDPYPIQAWTSEMWCTNWTLWKHGGISKVTHELHFHFGTHRTNEFAHAILHITGHTVDDGKHFCKSAYVPTPFKKKIKCSKRSLSYYYVIEIREVENKYPELIW